MPDSIHPTRYVIHSLEVALSDALFAESDENAVGTAVNRGGDTDTIGAITGAIAGARFGSEGFPNQWIETVDRREELIRLAIKLNRNISS